ncbi:MAG: hypothetical protein AB1832_12350 [Pseudomonadota bacterium]
MLTKDQAQAASNALLQPARTEQVIRAAKFSQRQRVLTKRKWAGAGSLFGLAIGSSVSSTLSGHPFTPSIIGFIVGAIVGSLVGKFRA